MAQVVEHLPSVHPPGQWRPCVQAASHEAGPAENRLSAAQWLHGLLPSHVLP
jgi:hypothetical protein